MAKVAIFTCPGCDHVSGLEISSVRRLMSYRCKACGAEIAPPKGEHCVICAFTDKNCPQSGLEPKK